MKKILLWLVCTVLVLAMLPVSVFALPTGDPLQGGDIAEQEFPISTAEQLEAIASNPTGSYYLTQDIDLGGKTYTSYILPIFNGILEGNGYSIYNFTLNGGSEDSGMIQAAATAGDTTVRNLQLGKEDAPVKMILEGGTATQHGILAASQGGTTGENHKLFVSNVTVYCDIQAQMSSLSGERINANIGGLLGTSQQCLVYGCTVNGSIGVMSPAGQKVRLDVAGICGASRNFAGSFQNCVNRATITADSPRQAARPAGILSYAACGVVLDNCVNLGAVTATGNIARAGGMISDVEVGEGNTVTVRNCANFAPVSATGAAAANAEAAAAIGHCENGTVSVLDFANFATLTSNGSSGTACGTTAAEITSQGVHAFSDSPMHESVGAAFAERYLETEYWNVSTVAYQRSAVSGENRNIRFIATVDKLDYRAVGFEGVAFYKENGVEKRWEFSKACQSVYQSILAGTGEQNTVTADELGGNYLLALSLKGVPATEEVVTILFRPFFTMEAQNGSEQTYYGNTAVVVMNGEDQWYVENFSKNPIDNFRWSKLESERAEGTDLRVLSWNILSKELSPDIATPDHIRAAGIADVISALAPDVMGIQELSETALSLLKQELGDRYSFVNEKNPSGTHSYTGILYDHTNWELLNCDIVELEGNGTDTIRLINWIHLKHKQTAKTVVVISTHWDTQNAKRLLNAPHIARVVKELETAYACPVIVTGDFNSQEHSAAHNLFLRDSEQQIVKYAGEQVWNLGFTGHNLGACYPQKHVTYSIDHITTTNTVRALYYETVINETVAALSDHFPIYADLQLP